MPDKTNIQLYYFGTLTSGFSQYPNKSILERHYRNRAVGEWTFVFHRQRSSCYYEYIYQNINTKLDRGRKGGHLGIAIELKDYYITDPLQAVKALKAMFGLLLKQGILITSNSKGDISFVVDSIYDEKSYLDKQSIVFTRYLLGEYEDYFQTTPANIPSPDLKKNHLLSSLFYDKISKEEINTVWKKYGIVTILSPNSSLLSKSIKKNSSYTPSQVKGIARKIQKTAEQESKKKIKPVIENISIPVKLVEKNNTYTLSQVKAIITKSQKATQQESEEKIKTIIENINSNTTLNNEEKLQEVLTFFNLPINKIDNPVFEETTTLEQDWASHIFSPSKPASAPFFKKHRRLIFAVCFIGLIVCLTPVIWDFVSSKNTAPSITEKEYENNPDSQTTSNGNKNNTPSGKQNNSPSGNKPVKVEQSSKCKNRHKLLRVVCVKGKARYYLKSTAFLKKHQGAKITSPQQFLDLLWSDIEGISIVMEVYDNDVDKMKKNVTTVLNQKSFPSIEAFISDQITEQIKKDSTKTITISTSDNTIAAMQGKANQAGKIGTQKGGEMLLYKEQ